MKVEITKNFLLQTSTDNGDFEEKLIPPLQRALQDGSAVLVTFRTEVEAIRCQQWALGYGKYRGDHASVKKKQSAHMCIASRKRNGKRLWLLPERF
jgi:uncharacterized protein YheU (UPF0270 family)